jgi:hypothetical protein
LFCEETVVEFVTFQFFKKVLQLFAGVIPGNEYVGKKVDRFIEVYAFPDKIKNILHIAVFIEVQKQGFFLLQKADYIGSDPEPLPFFQELYPVRSELFEVDERFHRAENIDVGILFLNQFSIVMKPEMIDLFFKVGTRIDADAEFHKKLF